MLINKFKCTKLYLFKCTRERNCTMNQDNRTDYHIKHDKKINRQGNMRQRQHTVKAHKDNRIQHVTVKKTLHLKLNGSTHVETKDKTLSFFSHDEKPTLCVFLVCAFVAFISS